MPLYQQVVSLPLSIGRTCPKIFHEIEYCTVVKFYIIGIFKCAFKFYVFKQDMKGWIPWSMFHVLIEDQRLNCNLISLSPIGLCFGNVLYIIIVLCFSASIIRQFFSYIYSHTNDSSSFCQVKDMFCLNLIFGLTLCWNTWTSISRQLIVWVP